MTLSFNKWDSSNNAFLTITLRARSLDLVFWRDMWPREIDTWVFSQSLSWPKCPRKKTKRSRKIVRAMRKEADLGQVGRLSGKAGDSAGAKDIDL